MTSPVSVERRLNQLLAVRASRQGLWSEGQANVFSYGQKKKNQVVNVYNMQQTWLYLSITISERKSQESNEYSKVMIFVSISKDNIYH